MYVTGKVTRKGQVTLPIRARKALGLNEGDNVSFVLRDGAIVIEPALSWVERTKGIFKHDGPPLTPKQEDEAVVHAIVEDWKETEERMKP